MLLTLDRMEIEDHGGPDPTRLAAAIHRQLGESEGAVPVREIALALDILEIRDKPLRNFEGALITEPERNVGSILVNSRSSSQRRRYSVGHELFHFLNPLHQQTSENGFECTARDMAAGGRSDRLNLSVHHRQEIEANRFAIELLAPVSRMKAFLSRAADIEHALNAATKLDISKQAATRRYVELHHERLAAVFSKDSKVLYPDWGPTFPMLAIGKDDRLPGHTVPSSAEDALSMMEEVDAADWLKYPGTMLLFAQSFAQTDGHAITLLLAESADTDDPGDDR